MRRRRLPGELSPSYALSTVQAIVAAMGNSRGYDVVGDNDHDGYDVRLSVDQSHNPLSRLFFVWTTAVTRVGAKRPLQPSDLWHLSQSDDPTLLVARFLAAWEAEELRVSAAGKGRRVSMFRIEWRLFWRELCISGLYNILATVCQFGAPTFVRGIVEFAEQTAATSEGGPRPPLSEGLVLAMGMFVAQLMAALFGAHSGFLLSRIGVRSRATLSAAVCRHAMRLNACARASDAAGRGRLLSLLTQDAAKVEMGIQIFHRAWMAPLYVIAGMTYIYSIIGFAAFVGFCFMCCAMPMQTRIAKGQRKAQRSKMVHTDKRVSLVSETLNAIKVVKLYAWELAQGARLQAARADELVALRRFKLFEAFSGPVNVTIPVITSVLTFIAYAALGHEITPAVAFAVVSLFQIVRSPFGTIPQALAVYAQVQISFARLSAFFELPVDPDDGAEAAGWAGGGGLVEPGLIDVHAMNFTWPTAHSSSAVSGGGQGGPLRLPSEKDLGKMKPAEIRSLLQQSYEEGASSASRGGRSGGGAGGGGGHDDGGNFELKAVELRVEPGELVMIVGTVGSGKSSLLAALLGLMDANPAVESEEADDFTRARPECAAVGGRLAYCTQQPFVLSGTVRENILFGHPYEKQRFADTVRRCCLESDLAQMPDGEDTVVGERGVTLSGGQKARVAMARAAYSRPDIVILDDPLAAVDSDVSASLMSCAILGDQDAPEIPTGRTYEKYREYDDEFESGVGIDCSFAHATCVLVTAQLHNCHLADKIVVMADGRIKEQGSFSELASEPDSAFAQMLRESDQNTGIDSSKGGMQKGSPRGRRSRSNSPNPRTSSSKTSNSRREQSAREMTTTATAHPTPKPAPTSTELRKTGKISGAVWSGYARSGVTGWVTLVALLLLFVVAEACFVTIDTWLAIWADDGMGWSSRGGGVARYIGVYGFLAVFYFAMTLVRSVMVASFGVRASRVLYAAMEARVLGCPMRFFDTTPIGQVINRFSKDITDTDESLTSSLQWLIMTTMRVLSIIVVISVVQPAFTVIIMPLLVLYHYVRQFYRSTSRELQRIESLSRSPVYALFSEIVDGHDTIHAYRQGGRFTEDFEDRLRQNLRALFAQQACAAWFSLSLQLLGGSIVGACAFTLVLTTAATGSGGGVVVPGLVGLALAYSNNIIINLNAVIQIWVGVETKMVGVERILEYANTLAQEKKQPLLLGGGSGGPAVPADWPRFGQISFDAVSLRYADHLPLALQRVSFTIEAGTVAGIVGRCANRFLKRSLSFVCA